MITRPEKLASAFIEAGSDMITMHIEAISASRFRRQAADLRKKGVRLGISLNPATPIARLKGVLEVADFVLVMSVNPGFSGQKFIPSAISKIKRLRAFYAGDIAVDGGVNDEIACELLDAGANILAAGSYIFGAKDPRVAIERLRHAAGN
jgi:ribulose-phosphate 3-epimerase